MKTPQFAAPVAVLAITTLALTGCGSDSAAGEGELSGTLTGIGASSQQAAMTAWQNGFHETHPGVNIRYSPDGSGAGREAFTAGGADFAGTDAYLDAEEYAASK